MTDELKAKIETIRELAVKATPSEWVEEDGKIERIRDWECVAIIPEPQGFSYEHVNEVNVEATRKYIVATQPQIVLEILAYIDQLEKQLRMEIELAKSAGIYPPDYTDGLSAGEYEPIVKEIKKNLSARLEDKALAFEQLRLENENLETKAKQLEKAVNWLADNARARWCAVPDGVACRYPNDKCGTRCVECWREVAREVVEKQ